MGEAFDRLAEPLRRFHRLAGRHVLDGEVETMAPASALARLFALGLGTPLRDARGPLRFELDATAEHETWTRRFPSRVMRSHMHRQGTRIVERLGGVRLEFELRDHAGRLQMRLRRLRVLGIPCPTVCMPRVSAEERGEGDRLYFDVQASLPWIGRVAAYRGHLVLPDTPST